MAFLGGLVGGVLVLLSKGRLVGHGHLAVHLDVFGGMSCRWWTSSGWSASSPSPTWAGWRESAAGTTSTLVASEVAIPAETVAPGDSLLDAIRRMGVRGVPSIPVVDRATGHLLGLVPGAHPRAL